MASQDIAYPPQTDYSYLADSMSEISLNILINSIAASSTLNAWDYMFVDIFSDADGADNTIDTAATTAEFDSDLYKNGSIGDGSPVQDAHSISLNNTYSSAGGDMSGVEFQADDKLKLTQVTKSATCTATHCYLYTSVANAPDTLLDTQAFAGNAATFSDVLLTSGAKYFVLVDKESAAYDLKKSSASSFPIVDTNVTWIQGWGHATGGTPPTYTGQCYSVESITTKTYTEIENRIVQTNAITITTGPTSHQVYTHDTLAGTGSITYDISFDNGSTWITGQELGTTNTGSHAGTQMILKLNLNGIGAGNTSKADDYSILLAY